MPAGHGREARRESESERGGKAKTRCRRHGDQPSRRGAKRVSDCRSGVPSSARPPVNVVIAGLGGQGVLTASDILADAAVLAGLRREEGRRSRHESTRRLGGQRRPLRRDGAQSDGSAGRSRFPAGAGRRSGRQQPHRGCATGGVLITPEAIRSLPLPNRRSANVALLGVLSRHLDIDAAAGGGHPQTSEAGTATRSIGRRSSWAAGCRRVRTKALPFRCTAIRCPNHASHDTNRTRAPTMPRCRHPASEPDFMPAAELREVAVVAFAGRGRARLRPRRPVSPAHGRVAA